MSSIRRIAKNTLATILSNIFTILAGLLFTSYFLRYLGPTDYGKYAFATSFVLLFSIVSDLGLSSLLMRECAVYREKTGLYFINSIAIKLILSIFMLVLITILLELMEYPEDIKLVVYAWAICSIINSFGQISLSIFTAYERKEYEAMVNIFGTITFVFLGFVGIYFHLGLIYILILFIVSYLVKTILSHMILIHKIVKSSFEIEPKIWTSLLRMAFPFALSTVFFNIYLSIDVTMLSYIRGNEAVGLYSAAYTFITLLIIFPSAFMGAMWPVFSRLNVSSKNKFSFAHNISIKYLLMVALPLSFGANLLADNLILSIYGLDYVNSIGALQILVWSGTLLFITNIWGGLLGSINKPGTTAACLLICAVINVSLNSYMIPNYNYVGASISRLITEIILFLLYFYCLRINKISIEIADQFIKPILSCFIMSFFIYITKGHVQFLSDVNQLILLSSLGFIIYISSLIALKSFTTDDIIIFRELLNRSSNL